MEIKPEEIDIPDEVLVFYDDMMRDIRKDIMKRALENCVRFGKDTLDIDEIDCAYEYHCSEHAC